MFFKTAPNVIFSLWWKGNFRDPKNFFRISLGLSFFARFCTNVVLPHLFGRLLNVSFKFSVVRVLYPIHFPPKTVSFVFFGTILFDSPVNLSFWSRQKFLSRSLEPDDMRTSIHLILGLDFLFLITFLFHPKKNVWLSALFLF